MEIRKNNSLADQLRITGNEYFKSSKFYNALVFYNKSLSKAIPGSKEFSMAIGNRSAVYMELKEFELCLENISLAVECGYPAERRKVLLDRREKCLDMLESRDQSAEKSVWDYFKLSYPANKKIPYAIDNIELRHSKKFGRHLITNRALNAGDIICIEEPFIKCIENRSRFDHCANCLKSEKLNLFPCLQCDCTMFCSKACMSSATCFHDPECNFILVDTEDDTDIFLMAHRAIFETLGIFGKIDELKEFLEKNPADKTIFDFDLVKSTDQQRKRDLLLVVNSLQGNSAPESIKLVIDVNAKIIQSITEKSSEKEFLDNFFRKQFEVLITNSYGLGELKNQQFGSGIFPFSSYFNHSCAPNVSRTAVENKLVFIVTRPIEKNHQLFVCYRANFLETIRKERREESNKSYGFDCNCEACAQDYPLLRNLKSKVVDFVEPSRLIPTNIESALEEFKSSCEFIDKNFEYFPCYEICTLMIRNRDLLDFIAQVTSVPR